MSLRFDTLEYRNTLTDAGCDPKVASAHTEALVKILDAYDTELEKEKVSGYSYKTYLSENSHYLIILGLLFIINVLIVLI